nr:sigma-70 family RNA polymerase sigma factor [Lewinella sp. W8]
MARAAEGDEAAFSVLYQRYAGRLFAYFFTRCGKDAARAEDLRQQVFLQLLESKAFRQAGHGKADCSSLLFTIAANLLKNDYRGTERRQRRERVFRTLQPTKDWVPEPEEPNPQLSAALAALPAHQRECLELRFKRGLSHEEIGELLDCPPGTVKSRLHYGLKKMATWLRAGSLV